MDRVVVAQVCVHLPRGPPRLPGPRHERDARHMCGHVSMVRHFGQSVNSARRDL
ncbi:hypothetical protein Pd630_LPD02335 [Rhodococcus opacus PD630]|nr:hypothetical protein Pd630_LPD02335 [Rhodococcus opacus PD630]